VIYVNPIRGRLTTTSVVLFLFAITAITSITSNTSAQGLSNYIVGTSDSTAATASPAAVHYNPAMTVFDSDDPRIFIGGTLVVGDIRYRRDYRAMYQYSDSFDFAEPIDPSAIDPTKSGDQDEVRANPIAAAPLVFATRQLGDPRLVGGFAIVSPYAALIDFPDDGPQRFQLRQATIITVNFTGTLSYRVHDRFSIGAGVSYVAGMAELSRVQDFATLSDVGDALARQPINQENDFGPDAPIGVRELDVMARPIVLRRAFSHSATFHAGIAAEPIDGLRIGIAYQHSTRLRFNGQFELDMDDDFFTQDLESQGLKFVPRVRGDATLGFTLPRSLRAAAMYDINEHVGLGFELAYTFWSQVKDFTVTVRSPDLAQPDIGLPDTATIRLRRDWNNTIGIDGVLRLTPGDGTVRLWGRAGFRQSAVPDSTIDVSSPDGDRIVLGGGLAYRVTPHVTLIGDAGFQGILRREVVGSDFDLANGTYKLKIFTGTAALSFTL